MHPIYKELQDLHKKYTRYKTYSLYNVYLKHLLLLINNELQLHLCFHECAYQHTLTKKLQQRVHKY